MQAEAADVLVLGAGLAGLRAAVSCLEAAPGLRVLVACPSAAPGGSSFANQNNALGMLVCLTDSERQAYLAEVLENPGQAFIDPALVALQAEEGQARFQDLLRLGLAFSQDADGLLTRQGSCFAPQAKRAFVFTGLASAHQAFMRRLKALGCRFLFGHTAAAIVTAQNSEQPAASGRPENFDQSRTNQQACGALFLPPHVSEPRFVSAKAVVVALGGPARLFARSMAPPGSPGFSHALLANAGTRLANTGFLQYMWARIPGLTFWQPAELAYSAARPQSPDGLLTDFRERLPDLDVLAGQRAGHCPFGYNLPDSILDLTLAEHMDHAGLVTLSPPDSPPFAVAPTAHATNGGARIDAHGQTSVPNLLACGECATGMHGSNRLGGAMVLATQVFGHRAGRQAARLANRCGHAPGGPAAAAHLAQTLVVDHDARRIGLRDLARNLSRFAVLGGRPGVQEFQRQAGRSLEAATDWHLRLALQTGLLIVDGMGREEWE